MNNFRAVMLAEGVEEGDEDEVVAAWQHLVDTGLAWRLQGSFGRTAAGLLAAGAIRPARGLRDKDDCAKELNEEVR